MPRPLTYERAEAGADSLNRIAGEVADEKRFRYTVERQEKQDARQEALDLKADTRYEAQAERQGRLDEQSILREQRLTENAELSNKLEQARFDRQTATEINAKKLEVELAQASMAANAALREINTDDPDVMVKLKEFRANHHRALGDPVIKDHYKINEDMAKAAIKAREEAKLAREEYEAKRSADEQKLRGTETIKEGERTITRPIPAPGSPEEAQRQKETLLKQHDTLLSTLPKDKNPTPAEIASVNSVRKQLGFEELDAKGTAIKGTAVNKVFTPADYANVPSGEYFIDPQGVKRRKP